MIRISEIKSLGAHVWYFTGKTLESSLQAAGDWARKNNVTIHRYYVQKSNGRSIIVDYS